MTSTCGIIGAGISGLTAAGALTARGVIPTLLEKSRGVGGRMATKRTDAGSYDQGAQFLTARTPPFFRMVTEWSGHGVLRRWAYDAPGAEGPESRSIRYIGVPTMTAVPKHLAMQRQVLLRHRVQRLERQGARWVIHCDDGTRVETDAVVMTPPLPQSLQILESSGLRLAPALSDQLVGITYNPCIALMVSLDGPSAVPEPGGLSLGPEPVRWIADNRRKGIQTVEGALTVHAGPDFSEAHYQDPDEEVVRLLLPEVIPYLGSPIRHTLLHRWRYSEPRSKASDPAVLVLENPPLIFAGDSFGGPSVEGAALSGLAAADLLSSLIQGS